MQREDYIAAVIEAHISGKIDAHKEYTSLHGDHGNQQGEYEDETDLEFIIRCAEQDFDDGEDAICFPELLRGY